MDNVSHFLPDVNDLVDLVDQYQEVEDAWDREGQGGGYIPAQFGRLVEGGMNPEDAADVVDFLADDGLPVCSDPPDVADDGTLVVIWPRMYQEAA